MESSSWPKSLSSNRMKAIQELTQGQKLTNKLREMLEQPGKIEADLMLVDGVVGQILGMFDNTLSILNSSSSNETSRIPTLERRSPNSWNDDKSEDSRESVKTPTTPVRAKRGCYKRRKSSSTFTKVISTLIDDGFAWRKYGQKVILNSKHHRNYYRCTHKIEQGCQATKQVQKTNEEPPRYKVTYHGKHTCKNLLRSPQIILESPDSSNNSILLNFETNTFTENKQVNPAACLPSATQESKEGVASLGLKQEQVSSSDYYTPWDLMSTQRSQVPSESTYMMSSGFYHEDMMSSGTLSSICSAHDYEIDDILGTTDFW
uniref:probable WRKY transcription factor 70 n=1 Tax=Erigeron canadensis TaxID=72917 RepID=UPI001CB8CC31|nr:probable WRKY transcription factor 70 [Erigeron canadensis]